MNKYIIYVMIITACCSNLMAFEQEVSELMKSADEHVVKRVEINAINGIIVKPDDSEQVLLTTGLGGCTAVALVAEKCDGERMGMLSHYLSVSGHEEHVRALHDVFICLNKDTFTNASAIIMTPDVGEDLLLRTFESMHESLALLIATTFERKTIKTIYYDPFAQDPHHALVVRIPGAKTEKRPLYRTWFCEGSL